ncbi:hypothetical protein KJZ61_03335 [Candidatus Dependentiae bacterium]|nr:hypothetical protein [Candidatus Dependentiae bacterium]
MQVIDVLEQSHLSDFLSQHRVMVYVGEGEYPLLFFMAFLKKLRSCENAVIESIDVQECGLDAAQLRLETSFLGNSTIYWLKSFDMLDEKKRKLWFKYMSSYIGPNSIMLFVDSEHKLLMDNHKEYLRIDVPHVIDDAYALRLMRALQVKSSQAGAALLARMFKIYKKITLDQCVHVMHYVPLVSTSNQVQVDQLIHETIGMERSLFDLASLFFACQREPFFQRWIEERDRFSPIFWCSFWSEQLLRAASYVHVARNSSMIEAKKISQRLPFSFIQKDWKRYQAKELAQMHEYLYGIDFAMKNGSEAPMLDLFYAKFFTKDFFSSR